MALSTYQQLQDSLRAWLWDRDDLHGRFPDFIAMFESEMNLKLRVRQMETSVTITLTNGAGDLPTDYLAWRRVYASSDPIKVLENVEPNWAIEHFPSTAASTPSYFYISGDTIYTKPVSSSDLVMIYYQKIPPLAENVSGNWLLSTAPNLYLYGSLVHAAPFLDDDQRLITWGKMRDDAVMILQKSDATERYAKTAARISGYTP